MVSYRHTCNVVCIYYIRDDARVAVVSTNLDTDSGVFLGGCPPPRVFRCVVIPVIDAATALMLAVVMLALLPPTYARFSLYERTRDVSLRCIAERVLLLMR